MQFTIRSPDACFVFFFFLSFFTLFFFYENYADEYNTTSASFKFVFSSLYLAITSRNNFSKNILNA